MLILASKSPRRIELLKRIYPYPFKVLPSNKDEKSVSSLDLQELPLKTAFLKGKDISLANKDDYVLSADTIVILNNQKYGKPLDENDARRMLSDLNEKVHSVVTGYAIFKNGEAVRFKTVTSKLIIHQMDKDNIQTYIQTGSPFDKAGAYGIQDGQFVKTKIIQGYKENIMGLPIIEIREDLIALNLM